MRVWYSGCALAFQANESGSIPDTRSKIYVGVTRTAREWIANPLYAGSTPVTYSNIY